MFSGKPQSATQGHAKTESLQTVHDLRHPTGNNRDLSDRVQEILVRRVVVSLDELEQLLPTPSDETSSGRAKLLEAALAHGRIVWDYVVLKTDPLAFESDVPKEMRVDRKSRRARGGASGARATTSAASVVGTKHSSRDHPLPPIFLPDFPVVPPTASASATTTASPESEEFDSLPKARRLPQHELLAYARELGLATLALKGAPASRPEILLAPEDQLTVAGAARVVLEEGVIDKALEQVCVTDERDSYWYGLKYADENKGLLKREFPACYAAQMRAWEHIRMYAACALMGHRIAAKTEGTPGFIALSLEKSLGRGAGARGRGAAAAAAAGAGASASSLLMGPYGVSEDSEADRQRRYAAFLSSAIAGFISQSRAKSPTELLAMKSEKFTPALENFTREQCIATMRKVYPTEFESMGGEAVLASGGKGLALDNLKSQLRIMIMQRTSALAKAIIEVSDQTQLSLWFSEEEERAPQASGQGEDAAAPASAASTTTSTTTPGAKRIARGRASAAKSSSRG